MSPSPRRVLPTLVVLVAALGLVAAPALAQFPASPADDTTFSLGKAIFWVHPNHVHLVNTLPGWEADKAGHYSTPYMFDFNTTIGHSASHKDGSFADHNGTTVGSAGSTVADNNFTLHPGEGPNGLNEIHTELYRLKLEEPPLCNGGFAIRAGVGAGVATASYGEVEALQNTSDFPAESFFEVYVEVDTPNGTLHNLDPLLIRHPSITSLPPTVVYIHGLTPAVKVFFKNGPYTGQLFGKLRLAGHGVFPNGNCPNPCGSQPSDCPPREQLDEALENAPYMSCSNGPRPTDPQPTDPTSPTNNPFDTESPVTTTTTTDTRGPIDVEEAECVQFEPAPDPLPTHN